MQWWHGLIWMSPTTGSGGGDTHAAVQCVPTMRRRFSGRGYTAADHMGRPAETMAAWASAPIEELGRETALHVFIMAPAGRDAQRMSTRPERQPISNCSVTALQPPDCKCQAALRASEARRCVMPNWKQAGLKNNNWERRKIILKLRYFVTTFLYSYMCAYHCQ